MSCDIYTPYAGEAGILREVDDGEIEIIPFVICISYASPPYICYTAAGVTKYFTGGLPLPKNITLL
jgi:hypothetical protein